MVSKYTKTEHTSVKGKCKWAHVQRLNRYDAWSIDLYPIPEDLERIRDWQSQGLKNILKKDDDGYFVRFRRDPRKDITLKTGERKHLIFSPPVVTMADDSPIPDGKFIGNGSDVIVLLEVYPHRVQGGSHAIAARLEGVKVENLLEYEPLNDYEGNEKAKIDELGIKPTYIF